MKRALSILKKVVQISKGYINIHANQPCEMISQEDGSHKALDNLNKFIDPIVMGQCS